MYKAMVRLSDGQMQEVTVQADNSFNATAMLEAQYGRGSVVGGVPFSVTVPSAPEIASRAEPAAVAATRSSSRDTALGFVILLLLTGFSISCGRGWGCLGSGRLALWWLYSYSWDC
jgi:hypothetical protein